MKNMLHELVMKEYQKKEEMRKNQRDIKLADLYARFPEIRAIDEQISSLAIKHAARIIKEGITPEMAVEAVKSEKAVLESKRASILNKAMYSEDMAVEYDCDICKDTGFVDGQKCKCYMEIMKKIMLSNVNGAKNLIFDFENDTFDNFTFEWYSKDVIDSKINISPYENIKSVYMVCKDFCNNFGRDAQNLYFYGSSGTGKTFMASCIANEVSSKGYNVIYQSAYKLFQFMEDYKFCRIDREAPLYDDIYNCDLLIIDDLGTEFGTAYTCSVLFDILNSRLLNEKSTIISSNLNLGSLEKKYTDRVHSRIVGNFEVLRFLGEDIRILKKQTGR